MRLSVWAAQHRMTAWRQFKASTLPPELQAKKIGKIVYVLANPGSSDGKTVGYARVSSHEQRPHLEHQDHPRENR